jgi:glucan phosphorylase
VERHRSGRIVDIDAALEVTRLPLAAVLGADDGLELRRVAVRQDEETAVLDRMLEDDVVPAFYDRDARGIPRRWVAMVKQSIFTVTLRFSSRRMLKDYVEQAYAPAVKRK